jgi:hypothetical protein
MTHNEENTINRESLRIAIRSALTTLCSTERFCELVQRYSVPPFLNAISNNSNNSIDSEITQNIGLLADIATLSPSVCIVQEVNRRLLEHVSAISNSGSVISDDASNERIDKVRSLLRAIISTLQSKQSLSEVR